MEDRTVRETLAGTPQGGVISPLLANIYLNVLDRVWERRYRYLGILIRYADDFVVLCRRESQAREAKRQVERILGRLGLELHPEKTRQVNLSWGAEGFEFLGCTIRKRRSIQRNPRLCFVQRWPNPRAMKRIRCRVHDLTDAWRSGARDGSPSIARDSAIPDERHTKKTNRKPCGGKQHARFERGCWKRTGGLACTAPAIYQWERRADAA